MPVKDGWQATTEIREWEVAAEVVRTPVIAVTANAMRGDRERCLNAGVMRCRFQRIVFTSILNVCAYFVRKY
jgi:CheY-like chemotaxis protein